MEAWQEVPWQEGVVVVHEKETEKKEEAGSRWQVTRPGRCAWRGKGRQEDKEHGRQVCRPTRIPPRYGEGCCRTSHPPRHPESERR